LEIFHIFLQNLFREYYVFIHKYSKGCRVPSKSFSCCIFLAYRFTIQLGPAFNFQSNDLSNPAPRDSENHGARTVMSRDSEHVPSRQGLPCHRHWPLPLNGITIFFYKTQRKLSMYQECLIIATSIHFPSIIFFIQLNYKCMLWCTHDSWWQRCHCGKTILASSCGRIDGPYLAQYSVDRWSRNTVPCLEVRS
jgi:hypothetical protein